MALYESNLEELSKEALIKMVQVYRKKEKMWKESAYKPADPPLSAPAAVVIPSTPPKKASTTKTPNSARGQNPKDKRLSTATLTKRYRQPPPALSAPPPQKKLEKISKEEGLLFLAQQRDEHQNVTLGSSLLAQRPGIGRDSSTESPSRSTALKNFIDNSKPHSDFGTGDGGSGGGSLSSAGNNREKVSYFHAPEEEIRAMSEALKLDAVAVASASTNEILARLNPDNNQFVLTSDEVTDFSPEFQLHLENCHANAMRFLDEMKSFAEVSEHAASLNFRATRGMDGLALSLFRLKNTMGEYGNTLLPNALNRFGEIISELASVHKELATDLMKLVSVPVRSFVEIETNALTKLAKRFKKQTESWEASVAKHMKKAAEMDTGDEAELTAANDVLETLALEYVQKLNEIEVTGKINLVSAITSYAYHTTEFTTAQHRLLAQSPPFLKQFGSYLTKSKNIIHRRLPALSTRLPHTERPFDAKSRDIHGYCHFATKLNKGKAVNWKLGYFSADGATNFLKHLTFESGGSGAVSQISTKLYPLLTSSVKPRKDIDRQLVLELNSMVGELSNPDKLHPETLYLQLSSPNSYRQWLSVLQNGIMAALAGGDEQETNKKQAARMRLPVEVEDAMTALNSTCVDCGSPDPSWAAINLGVMMCIECSGVHRAMGVKVSKVRSLTLDKWDRVSYQMMLALGNATVNELLEARLKETLYKKPDPDAFRIDRERFIEAKYVKAEFLPKRGDEDVNLRLHSMSAKGDLMKMLYCLLSSDCDVNSRDKEGYTPLHKAIHDGHYLAAQLLISNGADVDLPTLDHESSTPLHLAVQNQDATAIALLVSSGGADISIRNAAGQLPFELCETLTSDPLPSVFEKAFEGYDPGTFDGSTLGGRRKSKRSATKPLKNKDEDQEDAGDDKGSEKGRSHRIKPKDKHLRSGSESSALATPSVGVALVETSKKRSHSHRKAKSAKGSRDKEKEKGAPEFPGDVKIEAPKLSEILVVNSPRTSALIPVRVASVSSHGAGRSAKLVSTGVKDQGGTVWKGKHSDYEVDVMGPSMVDGSIVEVGDDGAVTVKFTPPVTGQYFVQVYYNDHPLFNDYTTLDVTD